MKARRASEAEKRAGELVVALNEEWKRKREYNLNALKKFQSAQAILQSAPEVQVAVAQRIVELVAGFAKRPKTQRLEWFEAGNFPWGSTYFLSSHLKKRLPFTDDDLVRMASDVAAIGFISARQFPFVGSLVSALERRADQAALSERLRRAIDRVHGNLLGKGCRRPWDPDAEDRRVAGRLERLLAGPLDLN